MKPTDLSNDFYLAAVAVFSLVLFGVAALWRIVELLT